MVRLVATVDAKLNDLAHLHGLDLNTAVGVAIVAEWGDLLRDTRSELEEAGKLTMATRGGNRDEREHPAWGWPRREAARREPWLRPRSSNRTSACPARRSPTQ